MTYSTSKRCQLQPYLWNSYFWTWSYLRTRYNYPRIKFSGTVKDVNIFWDTTNPVRTIKFKLLHDLSQFRGPSYQPQPRKVAHLEKHEPESGEAGVEHQIKYQDQKPRHWGPGADGPFFTIITKVFKIFPSVSLDGFNGSRPESGGRLWRRHCWKRSTKC